VVAGSCGCRIKLKWQMHISFAGEGYRSAATEVFSTPALHTGPKKVSF